MEQRAHETSGCARHSKFQQQAPIDVATHRPETLRRADYMWYRYGGDREPRIEVKRQDWSEQTSDAESGNRRYASGEDAGKSDQSRVYIRSRGHREDRGDRSGQGDVRS
jgi:hypothetical protein